MCKRGLSVDLRNVLHKAKTTRLPFSKEGIVLEADGVKKIVTLEVIPILNTISLYYLILFKNTSILPSVTGKTSKGKAKLNEQYARALQLEEELSQTREDMRTITEDQEAGNEELLSANEELLSGSEELRSLNEELEISKEELQSTVEELSVANQELSFRNDELVYARKYLEAIIGTISDPLIVLNRELQVKSANDAFYRFFNLLEKETVGRNLHELDSRHWNVADLKTLLDGIFGGALDAASHEFKLISKKMGEHILSIKGQKIIRGETSEELLLVILEDITERKNYEKLLSAQVEYARLVLNSSPMITSTASADGYVTYSNKFFLDYAGLTLEQAVSQGWGAVTHPDQDEEITKAWMQAVAHVSEFKMEMLLKRHDGMYRWHLSHALPIRDNEGVLTSWVCTSADIHDQKMFSQELERQIAERTQVLKDTNHQLEHSNKNLEQFAFIASHDLQEPLRKIQTFVGILLDNFKDQLQKDGQNLLDKIQAATKRLSALIHDVLRFSRISRFENGFVMTDMNRILADVIADFSLLIEEKRVEIKADVLPTAELIPIQINQLFYNLLSNALKFSKADERPFITITSRKLLLVEALKYPELNPKINYFEIVVADNGIGFEEDYKEKIFEIFQRLHNQSEYTGTGMGLALCKRIVLNHNGLIFAESKTGIGSLFRIILPLNDHHPAFELLPGYQE
jgi:two-component system CheB/CheR fusion protein